MADWHVSCADPTCPYRCARPGCTAPQFHGLAKFDRASRRRLHTYACDSPIASVDRPAAAVDAPTAAASRKPLPVGRSRPRRSHRPTGSPTESELAAALSSMTLKDGLRAARAHKAVRMIAYLQIKAAGRSTTNWPAVPIAKSKGAALLQWSEATWTRAVREAERLGWIERNVRSGRVRGMRNGYNAGSLYRVIWSMLPGGRPAMDGGAPLVHLAARTERVQRQPQSGNLHDGLNNSYSPDAKEPRQFEKQPRQLAGLSNSEPRHVLQQPGQVFDLETASDLDPVPYRERGRTAAVEGRGQQGVPVARSVEPMPPAVIGSSPPLDPPKGGPTAEQGMRPCRYHSASYVCDFCRDGQA
jgi:hypothetical protein